VVQLRAMKHSVLVLALALTACGTPVPPLPACSAATCQGCCDSTDKCRVGTETDACGAAGLACNVCVAGQQCQATVCAFPLVIDAGFDGGAGDAGMDAGIDAGVDAGTLCPSTPITCSDQAIQNLDLKNVPNDALITNANEDAGFKSTIDATAGVPPGGITPVKGFVYGKFTDTGLVKVSLSDEAALSSLDWDIAFRRFVIRVNSGSSGPSCVKAVATAPGTPYETLLTVPQGGTYVADDFNGPPPNCMFKEDGSGLATSPSTALANPSASFYNYNTCVAMTNRVFLVRTRAGRHVKLVVTNYYPADAAQLTCNGGTSPMTAGATIKVRWSFLD
jgi:hypothetical protein